MKKIKFTCSSCDAKLRVPSHLAGVSAPCPKCGATITAPADLDQAIEESPKKVVSEKVQSRSASAGNQSPKSQPIAGSAITTPDAPATESVIREKVRPAARETPVSRTQAPISKDVSPVLAEPVPVPQDKPGAQSTKSLPEPIPPSPENISIPEDSEPDLIVTEEVNLAPSSTEQPGLSREIPTPSSVESTEGNANQEIEVPLSEETQPIRVTQRDNSLPSPQIAESSSAELPRLDTKLADSVESQQETSSLGLLENPPKKVQLPQVGSTTEFSSEDFFGSESSLDEPPSSVSPSSPIADPVSNTDLQFDSEESQSSDAGSRAVMDYPEEESPSASEEENVEEWAKQHLSPDVSGSGTPMDDLIVPETGIETESPLAEGHETTDSRTEADDSESEEVSGLPFGDELPAESILPPSPATEDFAQGQGSLHEGSFENLLTQSIETGLPSSDEESDSQSQVVSSDFPFSNSAPSDSTEVIPPTRPDQMPARTDADVLDEMFGGQRGKRRFKKSTIVMLSVISAVVIIAVIIVTLIGKALGGFNPTIAERAQNNVPPPPFTSIDETTPSTPLPVTNDPPASIDPVARERVEPNPSGNTPLAGTDPDSSGNSSTPETIAPPVSGETVDPGFSSNSLIGREDPSLTFDERLDRSVKNLNGEPESNATTTNSPAEESGTPNSPSNEIAGTPKKNYNPPASFPAPNTSGGASPLGKTHDLLDAFLRAPDWETQLKYVYQGESLRPTIEEYYKKYAFTSFERISLQLFQMEQDPEMGGPYWGYFVSASDTDQGYPVIIRVEDGNLKVDWEIYSEFQDQHFAQFLKGSIASPHTFRVVIERVSNYFGPDRADFADLDDYLVYQINPPYGDFSDYAFVKRDSEVARKLDEVVSLGEDPLAVIITLEQRKFGHGVVHEVVTDYVTEGWFREDN